MNPITGNQIASDLVIIRLKNALGHKTELTMTDSYHNLLITHKFIFGSRMNEIQNIVI